MRRYFYLFIVIFLFLPIYISSCVPTRIIKNISSIDIYFSPGGGCTAAIIKEINEAKYQILIQAYSFTSAPIAAALVNAHKRGVSVLVILDKSQKTAEYSSFTFFKNSGIQTLIDYDHAIAHNKVIIIDDDTVITGSFNFSKAAEEKNAENLLIIKSCNLVKLYRENWRQHQRHSGG